MAGGSETECHHVIKSSKLKDFYLHLRVKNSRQFAKRTQIFQPSDWQELPDVTMKYQRQSFVWPDIDWGDVIDVKV